MKIPYLTARWIMIFLVGAETLFGTYFIKNNIEYIAYFSVGYFVCGLLIALFPMMRYESIPCQEKKGSFILKRLFIAVAFAFVVYYAVVHIYWILDWYHIDYRNADMIPQIIISGNRWISGIWVYQPMPEIWNGMIPTYLPLMWLPYIPLQLLGIDVRWTSVFFYLVGIGLLVWMLARYARVSWVQLIIVLIFVYSLVFIQTDYNRIFFAWTEEGLVTGYFILLGYGITKNNPWFIGIGITFCLLSRYSLFFWIPAFFLFQFFSKEKKKVLFEASIVTFLTLIIFIIPFFSKDPMYFLQLPSKYSEGSIRTWTSNPPLISKGLGFAKFFSIEQISLLHNLQLFFAIVVPAVFYFLIYSLRKKPFINLAFAGLCGLKMTLVFFYNFLEVPYYYLFIVNTLFSYVILIHFLNPASQQSSHLKPVEIQ